MNARDKQIATDLAYKIIRDVSRAIRPYVGKPESGEKIKMGADGTPTSLIDVIAEERIINILKNAPVLSYIISEEVGELKLGKGTQKNIVLTQELRRTDLDEEDTPKFIFLIDPVDGTNNAIKEIPAFGISIAIANVEQGRLSTLNDVELAFISSFANGNFFEAEKGKGCLLNNEEVHPSDVINISDMTLGGFTKSGTSQASKLVDNARRMRVLGSVVLELSYVASGRYDAFLDLRGSRIIDIAASKLILEEAGCIITNKYGQKLNNILSIYEKTIVVAANNKIMHKQIIDILNDNQTDFIGKVGVISRIDQKRPILFAAKVIDYLLTNGREVTIEKQLAKKLTELKENPNLENIIGKIKENYPEISHLLEDINMNIDFKQLAEPIKDFDCDMALILGGDGTLLRAQSRMKPEIPIFGINMGTVGFLTEIEAKDTFESLDEILKGNYYKEKRTRLVVSHENNRFTAMNEVVIMTDKPAKMLHFEIKVDGEIIEGEKTITVKLLKKGKSAVFVMDGQINEEADYEEEIKFKKADKDAYFIRTSTKYFYEKVKDKLKEGGINSKPRCDDE